MSLSQIARYVGGTCKNCLQGEFHQYPQDAEGTLRCGRCGELKPVAKTTAAKKAAASVKEEA